MASLSGVSSSNTVSSLYNSANVISGLASGLDTEGMIENLVKSYQTKINSLNQQVTKTEWKQEAYRSIISKMVGFTNKYTSYNSPATNLMSRSFFTNAVKVATQGLYKDKVTASGKTSSDIALNAVHQLATAAQYRVGDGLLNSGDGKNIQSASDIKLFGDTTLGALSGSMTVTYGSQKLNINFDEVADQKAMKDIRDKLTKDGKSATEADVLAGLINQKLEGQKITFSNGQSENAQDRVKAVVEGGEIVFKDQKASAGNALYISQASGNVAEKLGLDMDKASENKNIKSFSLDGLKDGEGKVKLTREENTAEYLSGKAMSLTLNGSTKTIYLPKVTSKTEQVDGKDVTKYYIKGEDGKDVEINEANKKKVNKIYTDQVSKAVSKAFGSKIEVTNADSTNNTLKLNFNVKEDGSDLRINSDVGDALGIGRTATTYLNTSKTLEDLFGTDEDGKLKINGVEPDSDGLYAFEINGKTIGKYSKDTKLSDILNDINGDKDAGVKVSYSQTTKEFLFSAKETGADSKIKMGEGLAQAMFGKAEEREFSAAGTAVSNLLSKDTDYNATITAGGDNAVIHANDFNFYFKINESDTVSDVVKALNNEFDQMRNDIPGKEFDFTASLDEKTGLLSIKDNNTGKNMALSYEGITKDLFTAVANEARAASAYTAGKDAKFTATVNGKEMTMTRSSNSVDIDGLTINMKETFNSKDNGDDTFSVENKNDSVTFKSSTDSDKIVDAVKSMIEEYNAMLSEIRGAYSTLPAQKTDGSSYEPLTSDQASNYSESEQQRYEEKAKQGILFADRDLSSLYNKLQNMFSPSGQDGAILRGMGITSSYDIGTGALTITLDEDKLRSMLDSDPDMVADAFTKTNGGVMQNLKNTLDTYAKTTGEPKGILIQKSGSPLSPLSLLNNTWQKQINNLNTQIEKWQDKMSSQVDRYTQQFSRLEQLIQQMNSQSSTLAGMMGGGSY